MRKLADRVHIVLLVIGIIAVITYPYLRDYSLERFMPRYLIFHWYLLFPSLSFTIGYFIFRIAIEKSTVMEDHRRRIILRSLYVLIGGYLLASILACIHCYIHFLPFVVAEPLLYWMAMIYEHGILAFAVIGGVYAVTVR